MIEVPRELLSSSWLSLATLLSIILEKGGRPSFGPYVPGKCNGHDGQKLYIFPRLWPIVRVMLVIFPLKVRGFCWCALCFVDIVADVALV